MRNTIFVSLDKILFKKRNVPVKMCRYFILGTADPVDVLVERKEKLLPVNSPDFDGFVVRGCDKSLSIP